MANKIADSRVKTGFLKLEDPKNPGVLLEFGCAPTSVAITPGSSTESGTEAIEVLCGATTDATADQDKNTATLDITLISDFLEAGLVAYSWENAGETRAFEWIPNGDKAGHVWRGTVKITPIQVGGEVAQRLTPSISWTVSSLVTPVDYGNVRWIGPKLVNVKAPVSPALKWEWDPAGALAPSTLAALKADANVGDAGPNKPVRDFTAGEYAELVNSAKVHYKATGGWATGAA